MADITAPTSAPETAKPEVQVKKKGGSSTLSRIARYTVVRLVTIAFTVTIAVYLTILIANMGGYVDQIRKAEIREAVVTRIANNPSNRTLDPTVRQTLIDTSIADEENRLGMNSPFIVRSFGFLTDALTLNLGRALYMNSNSGSNTVRLIILERLPATLMLFWRC